MITTMMIATATRTVEIALLWLDLGCAEYIIFKRKQVVLPYKKARPPRCRVEPLEQGKGRVAPAELGKGASSADLQVLASRIQS